MSQASTQPPERGEGDRHLLADLGDVETVAREKAILAASERKGGTCVFPSSCEDYAAFRDLATGGCIVLEPAERAAAATR